MSGHVLHTRWDRRVGGGRGGAATAGADRPPFVLLGSLGSDTTMWDPQVPALSALADVVRVDHRGHGSSAVVTGACSLDDLVDDLVTTLDHEGVGAATLVGLSLGGMVALAAALRYPQRFSRLVVICSSARLPPASAWVERAERVMAEGAGVVASDVVSRWFTPAFAARHPDDVTRMVAMIQRTSREGYAGCCHAIAGMDLLEQLPELQSDLLAIAGSDDLTTPPVHLSRMVAASPRAQLVEVQGAHLASWECAGVVTQLIADHLVGC